MQLSYRDLSQPGFAIWAVSIHTGQERELAEAILDRQADVVYLPNASRSSVQRLERAGIPLTSGTTATVWRRPHDIRSKLEEQTTWISSGPIDWVGMEQQAVGRLLPCPGPSTVGSGERFLMLDGQVVARVDVDDLLEVTSRSLDAATMEQLPCRLLAALAPDARLLVPNDIQGLNQSLAQSGFLPVEVREPYTLSPLLGCSTLPPLVRPFSISHEEVEEFGRQSGDLNPLHFDDNFAKACGFERRISHGMIFNGWLTKLLGTEYPGPGTIFLRNSTTFHAPVYPGDQYEVRISVPLADEAKGIYRIVAQLRSTAGKLVTLSYNEVMYQSRTSGV